MSNKENEMIKCYKEALELISQGSYDATKVLLELAKENPLMFIRCVNKTQVIKDDNYQILEKACQYLISKRPIEAIKLIRESFDFGLKEARDICDKVRYTMTGDCQSISNPDLPRYDQEKVYYKMVSIIKTLE